MNPMIAQAEPEMKQDIDQVGNILQRMLILTGDEEKMLACVRKWGQRDQAQRATSVPGPAGIFDHFLLLTKLRSYSRRAARNAWIEEHASVFDGLFYELKGSRLNEFRRLVSLSRHEAAIGPTTERSENEWKGMGRQVALGLYGINEAVGLGLTQQFDDMAATTTDKLQSVINMFGGHHELARPQALTPYIAQQYAQLTPMVRDALGANKDNDVSVFGMTADQFGQFGGKGVSFLVNMGLGKAMAATKVVQTGNTLLDATQAMNESMGKIADRVLARRKENPSLTPFECLEDKEVLEDLVDIVAAAAQMGTAFAGSGKSTVGLRKKLKMLRLGTRFVQAGFRVDKSAELIARQVVAINARTPNASLADYLEDDQILNELVAAALASAEMGKTASGLAAPKSRIGLWAAKLEKTAQGLGGVGTAAAMLSANSSLHTLVEMALKLHVAHPQGDPADFLHDAGVRSEAGRLLGAAATLAGTGSQGKKLYTKTASMGSQVQLALTFGRAGGQAITGVFSAISKRVGELQEADPFAPVSSYINDEGVSKQIEGLFQVVSAPGFADDALTRGRDRLISGAGKALSGFTLHRQFAHDGELTGPFCPERMAREPKSAEEEVSGGATLFINGVNTTYEYHRKTAQRLANETGQVVAGIYNATGVTQGKGETLGLWRDVAQTMGDKLFDTGRNPAVSRLVDLVLRYGDAKHPDGKMKIIAHSQGSVIVSEALRQARKKNNDLSHLDVTTFGNAAFTFPKGATYHNYVFDSDVFASTLGTNSRIAHWMNRNPVGAWLSNRLLGPVDDALAHTTVMHQSGGPLRAHQVNNKAEDAPDGGPDYISSLGRFRAKEKAVRKSPGLLPSYMNAEASTGFGLARNLGSGLAGGISSLYGKADKGIRSLPSLPFLPKNTVWGGMDWLARKGGSALTHAGDWLGRHHDNSYGKDFAQRSAVGTRPNVDPVALRDHLHREGGSGVTPSSHLRQQLGGHLGFDPSGARLHTGPAAAQAARSLNAEAFTIGRDVFFGNGHFDPTTPKGLGLIAHELTHVGQQTGTTGNKARFFSEQGGDEMEREAQGVGARVLANAGSRSGLFVEDYIREYEGEQALTQADHQRLDRISVMALEEAQRMLASRGAHANVSTDALDVQVGIDLGEMSDGEAARTWAEAIVGGFQADRDLTHRPKVTLQRSDLSGPQQETNEHKHLRLHFNLIEDDVKSMRKIHNDYVQSNNWNIFRWTSDRLGNGSAPPVGIWDRPGPYIRQGWTYLEQGNIDYAAETLRDAEEALNQAKQKWQFYLDGTIAGAEKGIKGAEVIRDTSIALEAGLAGAAVAPLVFAGAAGVATTAGVTGVSATILSGVAAVGVSAVTGGVVQGGIEKAYFGDKRGGFGAGFKRGAVSGAMGGGGALAAPGISAAISSRAFGTTPELLTTFGQRAAVNALTGAAIGAPLNGVNSAIVNLPALSNGMISSGEYLKRIGWDSLYGAMIGGGLGILGSIGRSKNTGLVKTRLPNARANWEPSNPLVDAKTGEIEVTSRNTQTGQVLRMKFNPNTGEGVITDLVTGDTMTVRIDPTQTNPAPHAADAVPQLEGPRIKIPKYLEADRGSAVQEWSPEAVTAKASVEQGATLYRIGAMGRSEAAEGQYWSLEKPTAANFLAKFGIPNSNAAVPDFYETAIIKPGAEFITRVAPGVGSNPGGSIEVVVDPGEVKMTGWHAMNIMEDGRIIPLTSDRLALPSGMLKATPMLPPGRPPLSDPMLTQWPGKNIATWENDPTAKVDFDVRGDAVTVYGLYRGNQPQGSGGEMLATSLKRAGASRPRVIVLDDVVNEPTKQDLLNGKDFLVTKLGRTLQDAVSRMGGRISETEQYRERTGSRRKPEIKIDVTVHIEYDAEK